MNDALDYVEVLIQRGGELTGVPTHYRDFDEMTGGLQPGELVVIAARPSMGKTALALNVARNAAIESGKKVAIFSLEMTKRALALRLLASEASIDFSGFRKGFGRPEDLRKLTKAGGTLARRQNLDRRQRSDHHPRDQGKVSAPRVGARPRPGDRRLPPDWLTATRGTSARTWKSPKSVTA